MIWFKRVIVLAMLCGLVALGFLGCSKFDPGEPNENIRPETTLSFSPEEGDTANYRVRMNWYGWDPDGEISHFWTRWDDEDSLRVTSTDSIFLVAATAVPQDTVSGEFAPNAYDVHTFSVWAVDNADQQDLTPETISFTAYTVLPETEILRGPSGPTGSMVTFEWAATDRDGVITGYKYVLSAYEGGQWNAVATNGDSLVPPRETTIVFGPLPTGTTHRFEVWAVDDAGAEDKTPAMREFTCRDVGGPQLFIRTNVFGIKSFRGPVWSEIHNLPTPIFAGERLLFEWVATGRDYGGEVVGYRHAYDDTSQWPPWSAFDTRFEIIPTQGSHSLYVGAIDNANVVTKGRVYFSVVDAALDEYILIVDDYDWKEQNPNYGTDEARSAFYDLLFAGYEHYTIEWEPSEHLSEGDPQPPNVDVLRNASTVMWYADDRNSTLQQLFDPDATTYNSLAGYVRVGGNLIMCGTTSLSSILYIPNYPLAVAEDDTTQAGEFVRDYLHIDSADNPGSSMNPDSWYSYGYCTLGALPADPIFEPMYVDSLGTWNYFYTGLYGLYPGLVGCGLPNVETPTPFQGTGREIFHIDAFINTRWQGEPCATLYLSGDNHGNVAYFGFPLFYMQFDQVKPNIEKILELFGEEKL